MRNNRIPFLLVQEGIRFPLPHADEQDSYGRSGATAIAAWGRSSQEYFESLGVRAATIHLTGNPRLEHFIASPWESEARELRKKWNLGKKTLLLLSNPIDDQGFCTTKEKLALIHHFIVGLMPLFADRDFRLIIKLHLRESEKLFRQLIGDLPYAGQIVVVGRGPLRALFGLARAAVVLASSTGLEALLCGVPLGVLEIPGVGWVHDYVTSGAALGLNWETPISEQADQLMDLSFRNEGLVDAYLSRSLEVLQGSARLIGDLVVEMTENRE